MKQEEVNSQNPNTNPSDRLHQNNAIEPAPWGKLFALWQKSCTNHKLTIVIPKPQKLHFDYSAHKWLNQSYLWVEKPDDPLDKEQVVSSVMYALEQQRNPALDTIKLLQDNRDDEERLACAFLYASVMQIEKMHPFTWSGGGMERLWAVCAICRVELFGEGYFPVWNGSARRLFPDRFFSFDLLAEATPTTYDAIVDLAVLNAAYYTERYLIVECVIDGYDPHAEMLKAREALGDVCIPEPEGGDWPSC